MYLLENYIVVSLYIEKQSKREHFKLNLGKYWQCISNRHQAELKAMISSKNIFGCGLVHTNQDTSPSLLECMNVLVAAASPLFRPRAAVGTERVYPYQCMNVE